MAAPARILVVGSANVDFIMRLPRIPSRGETVGEGRFQREFGGKGANQAVAAARAGGRVTLLAAVGADDAGDAMLDQFKRDGIDVGRVVRASDASTGAAVILFDDADNCIGVAPGANAALTPDRLDASAFDGAAAVLLQLETPPETARRALRIAAERGVASYLNYAPSSGLPIDVAAEPIGCLIVNEHEAAELAGIDKVTPATAAEVAEALRRRGPGSVVVTLGAAGAVAVTDEGVARAGALAVDVVDTTAAGDTFCGVLAALRAEGRGWADALRLAARAGSLCCATAGAQPSIPHRCDYDDFA